MQSAQIERVMNLIRRTGDRCILVDSQSDDVLVMMQLGEYEKLLDGSSEKKSLAEMSEREMMDRVNREMAYWRSLHAGDNGEAEEDLMASDWDVKSPLEVESRDINNYSIDDWPPKSEKEQNEKKNLLDDEADEISASDWENDAVAEGEIPEEITKFGDDLNDDGAIKSEEPLGDLPDEEEETFLLEPV